MTSKQLGGACDKAFQAETFEEIIAMHQEYVRTMVEAKNEAHIKAMAEMKVLMSSPDAMQAWFESKRREFDALPEDEKTCA